MRRCIGLSSLMRNTYSYWKRIATHCIAQKKEEKEEYEMHRILLRAVWAGGVRGDENLQYLPPTSGNGTMTQISPMVTFKKVY